MQTHLCCCDGHCSGVVHEKLLILSKICKALSFKLDRYKRYRIIEVGRAGEREDHMRSSLCIVSYWFTNFKTFYKEYIIKSQISNLFIRGHSSIRNKLMTLLEVPSLHSCMDKEQRQSSVYTKLSCNVKCLNHNSNRSYQKQSENVKE